MNPAAAAGFVEKGRDLVVGSGDRLGSRRAHPHLRPPRQEGFIGDAEAPATANPRRGSLRRRGRPEALAGQWCLHAGRGIWMLEQGVGKRTSARRRLPLIGWTVQALIPRR